MIFNDSVFSILSNLRKETLRNFARGHKLKLTGTKKELVIRILNWITRTIVTVKAPHDGDIEITIILKDEK